MRRKYLFLVFIFLFVCIAFLNFNSIIFSDERIITSNTYDAEVKYTKVNQLYNNHFYNNKDDYIINFNLGKRDLRNYDLAPSLMEQIQFHTVKYGETLWSIAHSHDINIDTLIGANNIDNMNRIKPGDSLIILPTKGILYKIGPGQTIKTVAENFEIDESIIKKANNIKKDENIKIGRLILVPGVRPDFGYQERLEKMLIPPVNARISSYYGMRWGRMHEGVDYAVYTGTTIRSAGSGRVVYSGWANGYGKTVIIEHRKGLRTLYSHNSSLMVSVGQWVERSVPIAKSGNTGNSTGPHLHFEVQINSRAVNPLNYLR